MSDASAMTPLKRAFIALEETRAQLRAEQRSAREPIAIIGLGCRVPGDANDAASFWQLLSSGVDAIGPLPADRWDVEALYHPDPEHVGTIAARGGGFLRRVDGFDPAFFGITPREAQGMDPQQRLLLEVCWEALEHAAQPPDRLNRTPTGVYVGVCSNDYATLQHQSGDRGLLDAHFASGIAHSVASGRLSYLLGLQGPSLTIDTACSSSLVAVHLACQALRSGDCRMALAGGVNLILSPDLYVALSHSRMLSPDGRCRTFDAAADGFARGEGSGAVVLKRLRDAEADGDRVLALILGSAVNQDGASSGLTAPNGPAQEAVVKEALARASVQPGQVSYIEAHGTGTQLGDPLELRALGAVFARDRPAERPLLVGSVKTNVGHLEAAAGVTGLIKLVLSLQHRALPPHLHYRTPTPHIAWDELRLAVPTELTPWEPIEGRRIAGISSFGFSGTNAHVVVEQAPEATKATAAVQPAPARRSLFVLSAFDARSLRAQAERHLEAFASLGDEQLESVCRSSAVARAHHAERAALLASSMSELRQQLTALAAGQETAGLRRARVRSRDALRVAFLFTGQGSQYPGMGRELFAEQPIFRAALERCAQVLDAELGRSLIELMYPAEGTPSLLDETRYTQPALFALEYALACLWQAWGVTPSVVIGHSVGEYTAACVAGVMELDDALRLIAERGRLMQSLPAGGSMAAVFAPRSELTPLLADYRATVSVAAANGAGQTVISGAAADVDAICGALGSRGVRVQRLSVSHAFHSPLVEPILDAFERKAASVPLSPPRLTLISNVTGARADAARVTSPSYWREHIRATVEFARGLTSVAEQAPDVCLELGPHPTLLAFAAEAFEGRSTALVPSLSKHTQDRERLDESLATLFLAGARVDFRAVWAGSTAPWIDLPPYAFQRERHWFKSRRAAAARGRDSGHALLGVRLESALSDVVQFESELSAERLPFLRDHRVNGRLILPGAAYVEMGLMAGKLALGEAVAIEELVLGEALAVDDDEARRAQTVVRLGADGSASFEILSTSAVEPADWRKHASGRLLARRALTTPIDSAPLSDAVTLDREGHLAALAARGLVFGPSLHGVQRIEARSGEARGSITLPDAAETEADRYLLHPALLDACLQVLAAAIPEGAASSGAYLPLLIDSISLERSPGRSVQSRALIAQPARLPSSTLRGEITIYDETGVIAELSGITLREAPSHAASGRQARDLYTVEWEPLAHDASFAPPVSALAAEVGPQLEALAREHALGEYHQGFLAVERLSTQWIGAALRELGWQPSPGEHVDPTRLAEALGVAPRYRGAFRRLLEILEEDGVLTPSSTGARVVRSLDTDAPRAAEALAQHPSSRARIELSRACGEQLAHVLRGSVDPLSLLFPEGSTELATSLYRDTAEARVYNQLIRETVKALASRLPAGRRLRVLEVGGGTGGTTNWVAPALDPARTEYLFTDVGPSLVSQARERFAAHAFMSFAAIDVERAATEPALEGRQFDVILASNVIHATRDLRATLGNLHALLAPGGTLLMLEVAGRERWVDITFGLTVGWWHFTDAELRGGYPLLSRPAWHELFAAAGFESAEIGAQLAESREVLLAARKPLGGLPQSARPWLILADASGVGRALAARLEGAGQRALVVPAAELDAVTRHVGAQAHDAAGIVHLGSLDVAAADETRPSSLLPSQQPSLGSLLAALQALGRLSFAEGAAPRLWIATRGAAALESAPVALAQTPTLGFGLGAAREHAELQPTRVDLDPAASPEAQADSIFAVLGRPAHEEVYAARAGALFVPRLTALPAPSEDGAEVATRLYRAPSGSLEDLELRREPRKPPGPGQIELEVHAAGLNFRDVMNAVAMRDDPEPLGGECAGKVVAKGPGVSGFEIGDAVVAIAEGCFATHAVADVAHVARLPARATFARAATVPFAFMTALFALRDCAALRPGETVLIHAAAGGVGLAAVRLALDAGATLIATAGSPAKRAALSELGVAHVLDSRSLAFREQVRDITAGRGVDVVLNSLAGDAIAASVACLAPNGRFLEIGKRDIWSDEQFARERPQGRYFAIDLNALRLREPARSAALFQEVLSELDSGRIAALPLRAFPLSSATAAFRFMAQARHIGKIVLLPDAALRTRLDEISAEGSYLITGGLSGLGLLTAENWVECGARHLALVSRRAPDARAQQTLDRLRARGAQVLVIHRDIGDVEGVRAVLDAVDAQLPPLRGVVHSAGALEDGAILQQSWSRFTVPLRAKVDGAWALHALTLDRPLDFFILYSSIASVLGSSGQSNHAAANAFLDALAQHRRALGLPGLSISWGAWSSVGAAADRGVDERVAALGLEPIAPERGLELLNVASRSGAAHVVASPIAWPVYLAHRAGSNGRRFFARVEPQGRAAAAASAPERPATAPALDVAALRAATNAQRQAVLLSFVGEQVARVVGLPPGTPIDPTQPLKELGLDSLMAVDLRNRLNRGLNQQRSLPATLVFDHPTLDALVRHLSGIFAPAAAEPAAAPAGSPDALGAIDTLTDEQIDALFAERSRAQ